MKTKGLLVLLMAVFLGVYVDLNAGAVNNILRDVVEVASSQVGESSFFVSAAAFYINIPVWITTAAGTIFRLSACLLVLKIKPEGVKQGGGFLMNSPLEVIGNGLLGYCTLMALVLVFILSVLGIPLAFAFLAIIWIMTLLGESALALAGGFLLLDSFGLKASIFTYMAVGSLSIALLGYLPILGHIVRIFLLPVICMGLITTLVYEGYLKKNYQELPFWSERVSEGHKGLREIIMKDLES
jgi:hypothetical protein